MGNQGFIYDVLLKIYHEELRKGTQSRNWMRKTMEKYSLINQDCSAWFLLQPKISCPWEALLKVGWVLPNQTSIKKAQVCLEMPLMEAFFSAVSSSLTTLACIKMAEKLTSTPNTAEFVFTVKIHANINQRKIIKRMNREIVLY